MSSPRGVGAFPYGINLGFWETVLLPPGGWGAFAYETNLGFWETVLFPPRGFEGHLLMRPI